MIRVVKSEADYEMALASLKRLLTSDPSPGTREADDLELLALLVEAYERRETPLPPPDPIEALRFRMEQHGLSQRDLVQYIGSRSKVSEVLSGKRALTLPMIRALHAGLGIPATSLLQASVPDTLLGAPVEWNRFPTGEMLRRGWIKTLAHGAEAAVREFLRPLNSQAIAAVLYRRTLKVRSARSMDHYALYAWTARVIMRASQDSISRHCMPQTVTPDFLRAVARLSAAPDGPRAVCTFLRSEGISVVIEPQLPRTRLDAAAILIEPSRPVIGLTLRHDRLDNFWFCLLHELVHIARHLESGRSYFYDDLDSGDQDDPLEHEADGLASEALIPADAWRSSPASRLYSPEAVLHLAKQLQISPAIAAGRIRHESKRFRILNHLVGYGQVRRWFPDVTWRD